MQLRARRPQNRGWGDASFVFLAEAGCDLIARVPGAKSLVTTGITDKGVGAAFSGSAGQGWVFGPGKLSGKQHTIMVVGNFRSQAAQRNIAFNQRSSIGPFSGVGFNVSPGTDGAINILQNAFAYHCYAGGNGAVSDGVYVASAITGKTSAYLIGRNETNYIASIDGATRTLTTVATANVEAQAGDETKIGDLGAFSGSGYGLQDTVLLVAVWPRLLSQAEANWYTEDFERVAKPQRQLVFVSAVASHGATGALSASAATIAGSATHLTLHTSTGALVSGSATIAGTAAHQHAATGALAASEATIAGTAARTSTGSFAATGSLTADAATIAGTAAHLTLHTATGALVADSATIAGAARDETTYVEATPVQPAGRPARRVRRVVVEIDGEDFIVDSPEQAAALLDKAKEEAEKRAEVQIQRATKAEKRKPGKVLADARKVLVTPQISAPGLEDYASKILADIRATYADAMQTIEVAALLRQREREEEDDEDVLLLML